MAGVVFAVGCSANGLAGAFGDDGTDGIPAGAVAGCGERLPLEQPPASIYSGLGPRVNSGKSYVGPAAVERSNADELVLAYSSAGATPELRHAKVSNPRSYELPLLPWRRRFG